MRILLDENLPKSLARLFLPEIEARTVPQEGWSGSSDKLLLMSASASFHAFITTDQGIPHQQNLSRYAIGIVLLEARSNRAEDLAPLVPEIKRRLKSIAPGTLIRVVG